MPSPELPRSLNACRDAKAAKRAKKEAEAAATAAAAAPAAPAPAPAAAAAVAAIPEQAAAPPGAPFPPLLQDGLQPLYSAPRKFICLACPVRGGGSGGAGFRGAKHPAPPTPDRPCPAPRPALPAQDGTCYESAMSLWAHHLRGSDCLPQHRALMAPILAREEAEQAARAEVAAAAAEAAAAVAAAVADAATLADLGAGGSPPSPGGWQQGEEAGTGGDGGAQDGEGLPVGPDDRVEEEDDAAEVPHHQQNEAEKEAEVAAIMMACAVVAGEGRSPIMAQLATYSIYETKVMRLFVARRPGTRDRPAAPAELPTCPQYRHLY